MVHCIFMPTTIIIDIPKTKRIKQYQNGINKIFEFNKDCDIIIADNGNNFNFKLNGKITVIKNNPNNYGKINKGAGLIEIWRNNIELLKQYDYIIHFEPRQLLINNDFINDFIKRNTVLCFRSITSKSIIKILLYFIYIHMIHKFC